MVSKLNTPGYSEEKHDAIHEWTWDGIVRGVDGAKLSSSRRAVYAAAQDHQVEEARKGNLVNVKVEQFNDHPTTGNHQWGIMTQPAYCRFCSTESGQSWRAPQRMTVVSTGGTHTQRPMAPQEVAIHANLQAKPHLIPSEEDIRAERRSRLGKYDRG